MESIRKHNLSKPTLDSILEESTPPNSERMNGQNSSRNQKCQNNGPPLGKVRADIPTLHIQPETPIPSSTRTTPIPHQNSSTVQGNEKLVHLPALTSARSLVTHGKPTTRQNSIKPSEHKVFSGRQPAKQNSLSNPSTSVFSKTIKQDVGDVKYGPQCLGIRNQQAHGTINYSSNSIIQNHSASKSSIGHLHLPNQQLQTNTPTPSEVSLIQCSPRVNLSSAYSVSSERNSISTPGGFSTTSDKTVFLEPLPKQQDWSHFKHVPSITPNGANSITSSDLEQFGQHGGSIPHYQGSISNLSPSQDISMYTGTSLFASSRNSASIHHRTAQKRALSISPISDGLDLNQIIRLSPTSLISGSRSSSISVSPQLGQACGSFSHLSARNSPFSHNGSGGHRLSQSHFTAASCNRHENANYFSIVPSENNGSFVDLMNNQCVAPLNEIPFIEQSYQAGHFLPQGSMHHHGLQQVANYSCMDNGINNNMDSTMNNINGINNTLNRVMVSGMENTVTGMNLPIRPPPPSYSQAVEQQHHLQQQPLLPLQQQNIQNINNFIQNIPTSTASSIKNEFVEEDNGNEKHFCEWIECNSSFKEKDELVRHIEKMHIDQRKGEDFTCFWQGCQRQFRPFNARYKLLIHMRVHSGEKPNKCTFENCTKAFSRLENLKIHLRSHTGERPYLCTYKGCTKAFSNSSDRAKHQRTHLDTKPYGCQVPSCTKRYTDPSSLRKHVKNHSQKEQQMKKKLKTEVELNQPDILNDCLKIHQLRSNGSPMDNTDGGIGRSPHSLISADMFSGMCFGNLSSRLGTTSISSQQSPVSMQHGSPMTTGSGLSVVEESNESMSGYSPASNHSMLSPRPLPPIPQHSNLQTGMAGYNYNYNQDMPNAYQQQYSAPRNTFFTSNAYTSANSCRMGMMQAQRNYANYQSYNYDEQNYMSDMQKNFNGQQGYIDPMQGQPLESLGLTTGGDEVNLQQYLQLSAVDTGNNHTSAVVYAEGTS